MTLRSRSILATLSAVAVLVATLLLALPAQATTHSNSQVIKNAGNHCAVQISPIRSGHTSSDIQSFKCYTTLSASLAAATNGRINLPSNASSRDVSLALQRSNQTNTTASPNSSNVILIFFKDANYQGDSYTVYTYGPSCSLSVTYGSASMPPGWNDVVSSVQGGFYGCTWYRLWEDTNYSGASQCYTGFTPYVGNAMNDQTSSWYVRTYYPCG